MRIVTINSTTTEADASRWRRHAVTEFEKNAIARVHGYVEAAPVVLVDALKKEIMQNSTFPLSSP